ncbi:hypothetical protein SDC9_126287 [bioreactor metagenome]|uniref:Uncharacterized protein n=1 Tax=bioreactor metagenome TaxID=1076179 RepID=A0A645CQU4_9ZZZZ
MGKWYKREENDYVIDVIVSEKSSGYNVVSREIDPYNMYDLEEVKAWCASHPEEEVVWSEEEGKFVLVVA